MRECLSVNTRPTLPLIGSWMREMFVDDEDGEEDFEGFETEWKTDNYRCNNVPVFTWTPGVKIDLPADTTPVQVFEKIFTEKLWSHLVTQTNTYSDQTRKETPSRAKLAKWAPVSLMEMKTFMGLCIAMGLMVLPVRRDYW